MHVLIIEPNHDLRKSRVTALAQDRRYKDAKVAFASSGKEALALLDKGEKADKIFISSVLQSPDEFREFMNRRRNPAPPLRLRTRARIR